MYTIKNPKELLGIGDGIYNELSIELEEVDNNQENYSVEFDLYIKTIAKNYDGRTGNYDILKTKIYVDNLKVKDVYCNVIEISNEVENDLIKQIKENI